METAERVDPAAPYDNHVLVQCPACREQATITRDRGGLRLTCSYCGHVASEPPSRRHFELGPDASMSAYNEGRLPFGTGLWLETECCGGKRLWALNERHLDYIERFVLSRDRDAGFPSVPGYRQLADKFPAWLVSRKHRDEVTRAIERLRSTL